MVGKYIYFFVVEALRNIASHTGEQAAGAPSGACRLNGFFDSMRRIMKKPAQDMRQHIIDVARSLMTQKGYTAVGLTELLAAAGVPKGSFYHYFRSKDEFGQALLEEYFEEYLTRVDVQLASDGSGAERLLSYLRYWAETQAFDHTDQKCLVVKLGAEVCDLSENMRGVLEKGTALIIERMIRCVEQGKADGSIDASVDAAILAEALYQMWLGASLLVKVNRTREPFDAALDMSRRLLA